jgi:hypothetical protein
MTVSALFPCTGAMTEAALDPAKLSVSATVAYSQRMRIFCTDVK